MNKNEKLVATVTWKWASTFLPTPHRIFKEINDPNKIHSFKTDDGYFTCKINESKGVKVVADNPRCVKCGLKPTHLKVYSNDSKRSYNRHGYSEEFIGKLTNDGCRLEIVSVNENGKTIKFTKDHIIPKARGGGNSYKNLQTMCEPCNTKKGCRMPSNN
jgi:hypothetical protein